MRLFDAFSRGLHRVAPLLGISRVVFLTLLLQLFVHMLHSERFDHLSVLADALLVRHIGLGGTRTVAHGRASLRPEHLLIHSVLACASRCRAHHIPMVAQRRVDRVRLPKRCLYGDLVVSHPSLITRVLTRRLVLCQSGLHIFHWLRYDDCLRDLLWRRTLSVRQRVCAALPEDVLGKLEHGGRVALVRFQPVIDQKQLVGVALEFLVSLGLAPRRGLPENLELLL